MKAILEFNLEDPSDRHEHSLCLQAHDLRMALVEFAKFLSTHRKSDIHCIDTTKLEEHFYSILMDRNISLE